MKKLKVILEKVICLLFAQNKYFVNDTENIVSTVLEPIT